MTNGDLIRVFAAGSDRPICGVHRRGQFSFGHNPEETLANARLIAAAPDMRAALGPLAMAARTQADQFRHQARDTTSGVARVLIEAAEVWEKMHDAAAAAIAKAEGR